MNVDCGTSIADGCRASAPRAGTLLRRSTFPSAFIPALFSDGDARIATDPLTGLNKYLCPPMPAPDLACVSSCTASPISVQGFDRALEAFSNITQAQSPRQRADRLAVLTDQIETRILRYFGVGTLARAFLLPSGTDALLTTAMLFAAERPGKAMTAILPAASETGTGVPMAAVCRLFDGAGSGTPLTDCRGTTVEIPLRSANGSPRSDDEVNDAFAAATTAATGSAVVYLTHGTKTGLIAPVAPPDGANVIVDACQARIGPDTVEAYLRRGWPVVVTGSKFFGGPAFSGAVLFPRARLSAVGAEHAARRPARAPWAGHDPALGGSPGHDRRVRADGREHSGNPLPSGRLRRTGVRVQCCPGADCWSATARPGVGGPAQHFHIWNTRSDGSRAAVVGGRTAAAL